MQIEKRNPKSLTPYVNNMKKHPPEQLKKLAAQMKEVGFTQPILVDKHGVIISGHGRREAAILAGLEEVDVIVAAHLSELQVKAHRIADNKVAESGWDDDKLAFEVGELAALGEDLSLTGFDPSELEKLTAEEEVEESDSEEDMEEEPEAQEAAEQFIVAIHCPSEKSMQEIYEELQSRGVPCKLIT